MTAKNRIADIKSGISKGNKFYQMDSSFIDNGFNIYAESDGKMFFNLLSNRYFPDNLPPNKYSIYTIKHNETLQEIAYKCYQNINLWWIIAEANHMQNPFDYMKNGMTLIIPSEDYISDILMENYSK